MLRGKHFTPDKEKTMNHLKNKLNEYEREADLLTSKPLEDGSKRARLQFLLSAISLMKRELGVNNHTRTTSSDPLAFRKAFLSDAAQRTYTPLSESADSQLIPSDFEMTLKSLMLSDGPLFAGSPILTNFYKKQMQPEKVAVSDDLSATGYILTENAGAATSEAELTLSGISIGSASKNYSSGLLLASTSLVDDVASWSSMEQVILKAVSARLSRIQNTTNLSALKTALALNSSAAVAGSVSTIGSQDIPKLVSAVGAAYRSGAAFVMSPAIQSLIALMVDANGRREYKHILEPQPTLLGYPVYIIASGAATDILFGDWSYLYTKSTPVEMRVLPEKFVDLGFYAYLLQERAEAKWSVATTSDSPVKYLTFA
jgi:HK97 family phage major capsid protein